MFNMGNWRQSGEVPDSDDEGLDSQELPASDAQKAPPAPEISELDVFLGPPRWRLARSAVGSSLGLTIAS